MTLFELTGQESGFIVWPGGSVGVYNWSRLDDDQMPVLSPLGTVISFPCKAGYIASAEGGKTHIDDVRKALPGSVWMEQTEDGDASVKTDMDIIYDMNGDFIRTFTGGGDDDYDPVKDGAESADVYAMPDGTKVIAPDGWN